MLTLNPDKLKGVNIPLGTAWLLAACMEARGLQDLWTRQKPEVLKALREQAVIQSAESSNRIEGVTVALDRLRPVVLGSSRPRDRSEKELAGYRKALDWIFTRKRRVAVEPRVIQHLHALAQGGLSGDAGKWKSRNNEIIQILPSGERKIHFRPASVKKTPGMVETLCKNLRKAHEDESIPPLLAAATFIFDLLCIHPFRDGNGRVSRLVTTFLLLQNGFEVGRYISLERLVEESKEDYYRVLAECSKEWHKGKNEIISWWNYFLGILHRAYREFEEHVESREARPGKSDIIRRTILAQVGPFTLADLRVQFPSSSPQLIKKVLSRMKKAGEVRLVGRGRGATWEVNKTVL
jgi:Fic family protein